MKERMSYEFETTKMMKGFLFWVNYSFTSSIVWKFQSNFLVIQKWPLIIKLIRLYVVECHLGIEKPQMCLVLKFYHICGFSLHVLSACSRIKCFHQTSERKKKDSSCSHLCLKNKKGETQPSWTHRSVCQLWIQLYISDRNSAVIECH